MILKKKNNTDNKILLVGGEGYIGRVVSKYLINKNFKVTSADNLIYSKNKIRPKSKGSYRFLYYDLRYKEDDGNSGWIYIDDIYTSSAILTSLNPDTE